MTRASLTVFGPVVIWALHFTALYALISAACAPRGLIGAETMTALAAILTGVAGIGCMVFLILSRRQRRHNTLILNRAAWWAALISLLAVLGNLWPFATLSGCTG